jgi:hypothetical protein
MEFFLHAGRRNIDADQAGRICRRLISLNARKARAGDKRRIRTKGVLMLQAIKSWFSQWHADRALQQELNACGCGDVERMAHDLGLKGSELRQVAAAGNTDLLHARLAEAGIDAASIDPAVLRDLQRCCAVCDSKTLCEHEVEDRPVAAKWPAYCPHEQTINALALMKCH